MSSAVARETTRRLFATQQDTTTMSSSKLIGTYTEKHLVGVTENVVKKKTANTVVLDAEAEERIPKLDFAGTCYLFIWQ